MFVGNRVIAVTGLSVRARPPNGGVRPPLFGGIRPVDRSLRCCMRALNSTYPNSWPGAGLFLLRLAVGLSSAVAAVLQLSAGIMLIGAAGMAVQIISATLLVLGLWTPVVGIVLAVSEIYRVVTTVGHTDVTGILRAAVAVCLVMTGPGAWSIDAHAFGRRRIDVNAAED